MIYCVFSSISISYLSSESGLSCSLPSIPIPPLVSRQRPHTSFNLEVLLHRLMVQLWTQLTAIFLPALTKSASNLQVVVVVVVNGDNYCDCMYFGFVIKIQSSSPVLLRLNHHCQQYGDKRCTTITFNFMQATFIPKLGGNIIFHFCKVGGKKQACKPQSYANFNNVYIRYHSVSIEHKSYTI